MAGGESLKWKCVSLLIFGKERLLQIKRLWR